MSKRLHKMIAKEREYVSCIPICKGQDQLSCLIKHIHAGSGLLRALHTCSLLANLLHMHQQKILPIQLSAVV